MFLFFLASLAPWRLIYGSLGVLAAIVRFSTTHADFTRPMTSCAGPGTRDLARAAPTPPARSRSPATQWRCRHFSPALGGRSAATLCAGRKAAGRNEIPHRSRTPASAQPVFAAAPGMLPCQPTRFDCAASIRVDLRTSRSVKPSLRTQESRALLRDLAADRPETPA